MNFSEFLKSSITGSAGLQEVSGAHLLFRRLREVGYDLLTAVFKLLLLRNVFSSFIQLLNVFVEKEWSTYVAEYTSPSYKYRSVNPQMVHTLLFK